MLKSPDFPPKCGSPVSLSNFTALLALSRYSTCCAMVSVPSTWVLPLRWVDPQARGTSGYNLSTVGEKHRCVSCVKNKKKVYMGRPAHRSAS